MIIMERISYKRKIVIINVRKLLLAMPEIQKCPNDGL